VSNKLGGDDRPLLAGQRPSSLNAISLTVDGRLSNPDGHALWAHDQGHRVNRPNAVFCLQASGNGRNHPTQTSGHATPFGR
jgi:hypothetical protein